MNSLKLTIIEKHMQIFLIFSRTGLWKMGCHPPLRISEQDRLELTIQGRSGI